MWQQSLTGVYYDALTEIPSKAAKFIEMDQDVTVEFYN